VSRMADQVKPVVSDSNGDISMSIEETNRVRASLGLRPLDVGEKPEAPKEGTSKNPVSYMDMKKAEEEEAKAKELREKIADMKRSRQAQAKVMASKGLGDASDEEDEVDDAAKWVMRSRRKQLTAAEKMAKQLDEQDEEMQQYDEGALAGMKVTHDADDFNTGETVRSPPPRAACIRARDTRCWATRGASARCALCSVRGRAPLSRASLPPLVAGHSHARGPAGAVRQARRDRGNRRQRRRGRVGERQHRRVRPSPRPAPFRPPSSS
jgi:hypothetical protein